MLTVAQDQTDAHLINETKVEMEEWFDDDNEFISIANDDSNSGGKIMAKNSYSFEDFEKANTTNSNPLIEDSDSELSNPFDENNGLNNISEDKHLTMKNSQEVSKMIVFSDLKTCTLYRLEPCRNRLSRSDL